MHFTHIHRPGQVQISITVTHGQYPELAFDGLATDRSRTPYNGDTARMYDVFQHINAYITRLSMEQQTQIYKIYEAINEILMFPRSALALIEELQPLCKQLLDHFDFEAVKQYIMVSPEITVPSTVRTVFQNDGTTPGTRAQTYVRDEYIDLVTLSTILRTMYPVFVQFAGIVGSHVGDLKDAAAYSLLQQSYLFTHRSMKRITEYVEGSAERRPAADIHRVLTGVSTVDFTYQVVATVVVRKISSCNVKGDMEPASPIHVMYQMVTSLIQGGREGGHNRYQPKRAPGNTGDSDENISGRFEAAKVATSLSVGDQAIMTHIGKLPVQFAQLIDKSIPQSLVQEFLEANMQNMKTARITVCQMNLLQYVICGVVSPAAILYMRNEELTNSITAAQAALWQRGHVHLAALISAVPLSSTTDVLQMATGSTRSRVSTDTIAMMCARYTNIIPTQHTREEDKIRWFRTCPVMLAISKVALEFQNYDWVARMPIHRLPAPEVGNARRIVADPDIVTLICRAVLDFAC